MGGIWARHLGAIPSQNCVRNQGTLSEAPTSSFKALLRAEARVGLPLASTALRASSRALLRASTVAVIVIDEGIKESTDDTPEEQDGYSRQGEDKGSFKDWNHGSYARGR